MQVPGLIEDLQRVLLKQIVTDEHTDLGILAHPLLSLILASGEAFQSVSAGSLLLPTLLDPRSQLERACVPALCSVSREGSRVVCAGVDGHGTWGCTTAACVMGACPTW